MSVNYTSEQVELMKKAYQDNPSRETVEQLADLQRIAAEHIRIYS